MASWQKANGVSLILALLLIAGCTEVSNNQNSADDNSGSYSGLVAIEALGCGACHRIPGISWPQSDVGPALNHYGDRGFIAGVMPNTAQNLAAFIQNSTRYIPNGAMPPIPMTESQAADISAYLLSLQTAGS